MEFIWLADKNSLSFYVVFFTFQFLEEFFPSWLKLISSSFLFRLFSHHFLDSRNLDVE